MTTTILINLTYTRSQYGLNPKASGKRFTTNEDSKYYSMTRSVSGCGFDKRSTAIATVLNELLTQNELQSALDGKLYGVSSKLSIDGACGTVDNIMRFLGYTVLECDNSIVYSKE